MALKVFALALMMSSISCLFEDGFRDDAPGDLDLAGEDLVVGDLKFLVLDLTVFCGDNLYCCFYYDYYD